MSRIIAKAKGQWADGLAEWREGNTLYLSIAFTWRIPDAIKRAEVARAAGRRVVAGGPALNPVKMRPMMEAVAEVPVKTILVDGEMRTVGGDYYDAIRFQNPDATIASRGCPVGCSFCGVPFFEGKEFTLLPEFPVRPILCDNNLSALPPDFQDHIISRYRAEKVILRDANSGFEPRTFTPDVYQRWKPIIDEGAGPWRFAYDNKNGEHGHEERKEVLRVMKMLADEPQRRKRVYVLIGNECFDDCMARINEVIDAGCEPHVQPYIKLTTLEKKPHIRFDWTERKLKDVARWIDGFVWKTAPFSEYDPKRRNGPRKPRYDKNQGLFFYANTPG